MPYPEIPTPKLKFNQSSQDFASRHESFTEVTPGAYAKPQGVGINAVRDDWNVTGTLSTTEYNALRSFLLTQNGMPFHFTPTGHINSGNYFCEAWDFKALGVSSWEFHGKFESFVSLV